MERQVKDTDLTDDQLQTWLDQWSYEGRSKNDIERKHMDDPYSHGKRITRLWRDRLGVETEEQHPMRREIRRLRALLWANDIDPDEDKT